MKNKHGTEERGGSSLERMVRRLEETSVCKNCHRVSVLSKSGKTYVCTICGNRERTK